MSRSAPVLTVRTSNSQGSFAGGRDVVVGSDQHSDLRIAHPVVARAHVLLRFGQDGWVAVEIKRVATIDAVEQLTRYLERLREDPAMAECQGVLAAQQIKPQARTLAVDRGIRCVTLDYDQMRGMDSNEFRLF